MAYGKRYFFEFYDLQENLFTAEIHQLDYAGSASEVQAAQNPVIIDYTNTSDNKLEPLRGSKCTLKLIADASFEFANLYSENEREWLVLIKRNADIVWRGFILPDGCQEDFSYKPYVVTINAVDGLGLLKNLKFVRENGSLWVGKMSFKDIIWNCLNRLQIPDMPLNTSVNIYPESITPSDSVDPLAEVYCDLERFYTGETATTPMTCEEVIKSVLQSWTACIVQNNGEWYIYRPNEVADTGTITFRQYAAADGDIVDEFTLDLDKNLGGQSEGATLFHRDRNQLKRIGKPYKTTSITYKYGYLRNLITNSSFYSATPTGTPSGWSKTGTVNLNQGVDGGIVLTYGSPIDIDANIGQGIFNIGNNEKYTLSLTYKNIASKGARLKITFYGDSGSIYSTGAPFLEGSGTFSTLPWDLLSFPYTPYTIYSVNVKDNPTPPPDYISADSTCNIVLNIPATPEAGFMVINLMTPYRFGAGEPSNPSYQSVTYYSLRVQRTPSDGAPSGETHTVVQDGQFTYNPDALVVLNGDGDDKMVGSLLIEGGVFGYTETTLWNRRGITENDTIMIAGDPTVATSKSFLRIATEEIARLYAVPYIQFEGSIFGYFNYLSRFSINDVTGVFMPTSLSYELQNSLVSANFAAVSDADVDGLYSLTPVYDNVTKVVVTG